MEGAKIVNILSKQSTNFGLFSFLPIFKQEFEKMSNILRLVISNNNQDENMKKVVLTRDNFNFLKKYAPNLIRSLLSPF